MDRKTDFHNMIERDRVMKLYIPLGGKTRSRIFLETSKTLVDLIFNHKEIKYMRSAANDPDGITWTNKTYVHMKETEYNQLFFRYKQIFDLCKVIGVKHLYDIGCFFINQSFLLSDYSNISYVGIDNEQFVLNDFDINDYKHGNIYYPYSVDAPDPYCGGRISFEKALYPYPINVPPSNIAISSYSVTNTVNPEEIKKISDAFARDFERVLFNTYQESVPFWKESACKCFSFFPLGHNRFVFGTRIPEDIIRLKEQYPFSDGRLSTGIDNFSEFMQLEAVDPEGTRGYIRWDI